MAFKIGDHILVKTIVPTGHCRTPYYLRGKAGMVSLAVVRQGR